MQGSAHDRSGHSRSAHSRSAHSRSAAKSTNSDSIELKFLKDENASEDKPKSGIRRRHIAEIVKNASYRLGHDGEADVAVGNKKNKDAYRGFPKSLTPFVHIQEKDDVEDEIEKSIAEIELLHLEGTHSPRRTHSPIPIPEEEDVESLEHKNKTISFDIQQNFHNSNLTMNSFNESFNNSAPSVLCADNGNTEGDRKTPSASRDDRHGDEQAERINNLRLSINTIDDDESHRTIDYARNQKYYNLRKFVLKVQKSRRFVGKIVYNEFVQVFIILLIFANGITMGFATTNWVTDDDELVATFLQVDKVFLYIFTVEIAMALYYVGPAFITDWWLVFDLVVVIVSYLSERFQVLRAFRIFRGFRLITRVKPLRDLVLALGEVLPRMSAIVGLLSIIFGVFGILFTELFQDMELEGNYFISFQHSLFTCLSMMTMEWAGICREVMQQKPHAWWPFFTFVMVAGFIVFNLLVAVVVEAVATTEETVRAMDGIESDTPEAKLEEAQERVDLLHAQVKEMIREQEQIQFMLESMAGELLHLETERMKAKYRENRLKEEINRRIEKEKKAESTSTTSTEEDQLSKISKKFLANIEARTQERKDRIAKHEGMSQSMHVSETPKVPKAKRRTSIAAFIVKPEMTVHKDLKISKDQKISSKERNMSKELSGRSLGTQSQDSTTSPNDVSSGTKQGSSRRRLDSSVRSSSSGYRTKDSSEEFGKKKRAKDNWKKMLAVQK